MCVQSQLAAERLSAIMLLVYGDESLDATQNRVCAVAGIIGPENMWNDLEPKWVQRNAGIPFHAADCESDHGDYEGTPHNENKALYRDLAIMLAESGLGGYAAAYDLIAQRKAFPSPFEPPLYYQGFMNVLEAMRNAAENKGDIAELTFDNRIESQFNAAQVYAYLRQSSLYFEERLASKLSFESSRANPRIQVADLFAHEAMKDLDNEVGPVQRRPRASWECLKNTNRFRLERFDNAYFSDPRMNPANLLKALAIEDGEYDVWLTQRGAPRCHTSFYQFLFAARNRMTEDQLKYFDEVYGHSSTLRPRTERI